MKKLTDFIVDHRISILIIFILLSVFSLYISTRVNINYDISKYLPETSETRKGIDIMEENFDEIKSSSLNIMFEGLTLDEKKEIFKELETLDGVESVSWDESEKYNKDDYTMFSLNVEDVSDSKTAASLYQEVTKKYDKAYFGGSIVSSNKEVLNIWVIVLAIVAAMIILIIMCDSYIEPFLFLFTIGLGVFLNKGTNLIFSSVSNITSSIAAILQMALSMDYSIMLMNRYTEEKKHEKDRVKAMKKALYNAFSSISSSSVTTIVGLLALVFMSFTIGKDLGFVLAKGVLFSLICIFTCLPGLILLFDNVIEKTRKKHFDIRLDVLGKMSYKMRYIMPIIFIAIFILSFIIKGNLGILYTGSENEFVGQIFKENNQMVLIYNNEYEDSVSKLCNSLDGKDNIDSILCYANTLNEGLTYNELNNKLSDLGVDTTIDEDLLKIIYYNYFNPNDNTKYSLGQLINLIENDVKKDDNFKDKIDKSVYDNIDQLKNFATKENINKLRTKKELSKILGVSENDIQNILIYYNSKDIKSKMTITEFVNFLNNSVLKDKVYSKMIPSSAKKTLNTLSPFIDKDYINKKMNSNDLSKLFGIDSNAIDSLMLLYYLNIEPSSTYTLNQFILATENIANNTDYLSGNDVSAITSLSSLAKNENDINNTPLPKVYLKNIFDGISPNLVDTVYYMNSLPDAYTFTPNDFLDLVINNMGSSMEPSDLAKLQLISLIMHNDGTKYTASNLALLLDQDKSNIIKIYNLIDYTNGKRYKLSPYQLVNVIMNNSNNPAISNSLDKNILNKLKLLKSIMTSVNNNTKYTASSLAKLLNLDKEDVELIYSLHEGKNTKLSLNNFIKFMLDDVAKNKTFSSLIKKDTKEKLEAINTIMNDTLNNKTYTSKQAYQTLKRLSKKLDQTTIELLYIYKGSVSKYNTEWKLTIENIINYLNDDILNDKRFDDFIDEDLNKKIVDAKDLVKDAKEMLKGDKYSRMLINTLYPEEGKETFEFIQGIKDNLDVKDKDIYLIGDSPMAYDISNSFDNELNLITILTMIFIFVVVALTFKSLIIPLLLVLIIQCAVFFTMGILSIFGGSVYFIALLIVQSILMGATIDYAIVYTSYYKENRLKYGIKESLINAYNSSIHTIISSGAVLIIVTLIVGNFASAIAAKICRTVSEGTICSIVLILLILPSLLAAFDRFIIKNKSK